ncbi:hypothetical protein BC827DRAFT_1375359 [Russula dissimulans]|jgi:hypothetical protein|nr:hypothetical protein BC827DRAFT_1375359 [Russula dissimulans]
MATPLSPLPGPGVKPPTEPSNKQKTSGPLDPLRVIIPSLLQLPWVEAKCKEADEWVTELARALEKEKKVRLYPNTNTHPCLPIGSPQADGDPLILFGYGHSTISQSPGKRHDDHRSSGDRDTMVTAMEAARDDGDGSSSDAMAWQQWQCDDMTATATTTQWHGDNDSNGSGGGELVDALDFLIHA